MKNKGVRLGIGVAAICCLFGAYVVLRMHNEKAEETAAEAAGDIILELDTAEITGVSFETGGTMVSFVNGGDGWTMEDDDTFPVSSDALNLFFESFESIEAVRTLEDIEDISEYGFDEPQNIITFTDTDGEETILRIGATNSSTGDDYLMLNEDETVIYTVDTSLRTSISDDLYDYARSETLPALLAANITEVSVERDKDSYKLYRADDTWCAETADGTVLNADNDAVNTAYSTLASGLSYSDFIEHNCTDGEAYGLDEPTAVFTILYEAEAEEETEPETEPKSESETETEVVNTVENELIFTVGTTDENGDYYVQMEGSAQVHTMSADTLSVFLDMTAADWEAEEETETETEAEIETEIETETETEIKTETESETE